MNIKTKVLVIVCTFVLIAGAVTIQINQIVSRNMIEHQVYNHLQTGVQSRVNHIESVLDEQKGLTETLSAGNPFRDAVDESKDHNQSMKQVKRRIKSIIEAHDDISRIRVLDKNGIVIASSHADVGFDKSAADIFLKGKEEVHAGDVHISASTGNPVMSLSAPILVNGEFSGVIGINFDAEKGLFEITTDRTGLGENGEMYLVNKDGYMITPSRFVNDTFLMQKIDTEHTADLFRQIEIFGAQEHEDKADLYKNYLGTDVLGVHAHIPEMDWCLIAEISEEEAFAPVAELRSRMLSIIVLILIMGMAFSTVLSGTLTNPIIKLHRGTEELEKGNLDYKVGTEAVDEIGQLSRAFDRMTAKLKESREELEEYSRGLEEKVKERTEKLAKTNESLNTEIVGRKKVAEEREVLIEDLSGANRMLELRAKELEEAREATMNIAYDLDVTLIETAKGNDKLEELTRKLERSNKDLQDFVYIVSHDLKAPVRKVSAFGDLLQESLEGRLDEDEQENFEFMIAGAARMQQLIDDLLLYSRVSTRAKPMARVDLNDVVKDLRNVELATELEELGGEIEVPEPLPVVHAEESQMYQLLQNLIGNGLKYHRVGVPPRITVRGKLVGNMARIEIKDNGIGVSDAYFEKIFMMFQRLHSGDEYEGTGVGLAVCKRIVERHGGEIGVESAQGVGSVFWFTVPIANADPKSSVPTKKRGK